MKKRWHVVIQYVLGTELDTQHYQIEEMAELQAIVEQNHDWRALVNVIIQPCRS